MAKKKKAPQGAKKTKTTKKPVKKKASKKASKKPAKKAAAAPKKKAPATGLEARLARLETLLSRLVEAGNAAPVVEQDALAGEQGNEVEFLSHIPLFSRLSRSEISAVALRLEEVRMPATELLFAEGDLGDSMYVVVSGSLEIFFQDVLGDRQIAIIRPGGMVGEMALIEGKPRSANVRAHEDCQLLEISKASFEGLKREVPAVATKLQDELLQLVSGRLRETTEQLMAARRLAEGAKGRGEGL